jgi:hypothetical protein
VVTLKLPIALRLERAKDDPTMGAVFYGPVLLAGELSKENMPNDFADKDAYLGWAPVDVPEVVSKSQNPADWLKIDGTAPLTYVTHDAGPASDIVFRPLYAIGHQRYSAYWKIRTLN